MKKTYLLITLLSLANISQLDCMEKEITKNTASQSIEKIREIRKDANHLLNKLQSFSKSQDKQLEEKLKDYKKRADDILDTPENNSVVFQGKILFLLTDWKKDLWNILEKIDILEGGDPTAHYL